MRRKYIGRNYRINIFGGEKFLPWSEPKGLRRTLLCGNKSEFLLNAESFLFPQRLRYGRKNLTRKQ
jgi:hypothetical protein